MANMIIVHMRVIFKKKERNIAVISYEPLWKTLREKGVTQYQLINKYHISAGQLSRLRANSNISTHTINVLCNILDCDVQDVMVHIRDEE